MNSAIFEGWVRHRRMEPVSHSFRYRIFMMYLDLDELDRIFSKRWLWSVHKPALARFRRSNHLGDPGMPLDVAVRELVHSRTGKRPTGPIRLLTHLEYFGYGFNPVSFYYCLDERGRQVETIVAEVNNTPWGEQHCYVLTESMNRGTCERKRYSPSKEMHVSPFMEMDIDYDWRFSTPDERLSVHMENKQDTDKIFDATLDLKRTEISGMALARVLLAFPLMTLKVILAIHWQALRLWMKRVPVIDHPGKSRAVEGTKT